MKKFLSLLLALILVLSLAACGEQQSGGSDDSDNSGTAATPQDLVMGTGSTGGTYFALGGAMANAINDKLCQSEDHHYRAGHRRFGGKSQPDQRG